LGVAFPASAPASGQNKRPTYGFDFSLAPSRTDGYISNANDALEALAAARNERDRARSRSYFEAALAASEAWQREAIGNYEAEIFHALLLTEMAAEDANPASRLRTYLKALSLAERTWKASKLAKVAETHSLVSIDLFQDPLVSLDSRHMQGHLRQSRELLDEALRSAPPQKEMAHLLTRKSAILRHQAQLELTNDLMLKRVDESVACAQKAAAIGEFPAAYLELGLAEWARSRFEKSDDRYVDWLRRAELHLTKTAEHDDDNANLSLARFYRMNYRPLEACQAFPVDSSKIRNLRKVLRGCYLYGEAATQIWFSGAPAELLTEKLEIARRLLTLSIAAGNRNARTIVALGFVTAIVDGPESGGAALSELGDSSSHVSWSEAVKIAVGANHERLADLGFALGIGNSQVWSSLGTYAASFMNDPVLVETLYREAVQMDPNNAVALTNLARFLAATGSNENLLEARKLVDRAASVADRRFFWWREVRGQVDNRMQAASLTDPTVGKRGRRLPSSGKVRSLKELPTRFDAIADDSNAQQRGYQLEALFYEAADLEFVVSKSSYRINRIESLIQQVDGYVECGVNKYRVECKWTTTPIDKNDIVLFRAKLDAAGVDGIFVSMAGFADSAITQAKLLAAQKAILLVDGDEVEKIFHLSYRLGDMITLKRQHFDMRTEVYHRLESETVQLG
jgi:hypothetical protein